MATTVMEEKQGAETTNEKRGFTVRMRCLTENAGTENHYTNDDPLAAFRIALSVGDCPPDGEPVICWDREGLKQLAILDVDFHGVPPLGIRGKVSELDYEITAGKIHPQPALWWRSHGGGIKLVYQASGPLTAEQCASVAGMVIAGMSLGHNTPIELDCETSHPGYKRVKENGAIQRCSVVHSGGPADINRARGILLGEVDWSSEVDPDAIDTWCKEEGFERGRAYEHSRCPIDNSHPSHDKPVWVGDRGIVCKSCEANGDCYRGMRRPGFAPWRMIINGEPARLTNKLRLMVKNRVHWEQAKHFVGAKNECGYRALLRLFHVKDDAPEHVKKLEEKLVDRVFYPPVRAVCGVGGWISAARLEPWGNAGLEDVLLSMPVLSYVDCPAPDKAKVSIARGRLGEFKRGLELEPYGYFPIIALRGVDMAKDVRGDDGRTYALTEVSPPFRYREESERNMNAVEAGLRDCFPGVNLNLLRLIVAAKGLAQLGVSDAPQIFIAGQSKAGKSSHARLAAEIACDRAAEVKFTVDMERFKTTYAGVSSRGTYAVYNEVGKVGSGDVRVDDLCLMFTQGLEAWALHKGERAITQPAVVIMTDPTPPLALLQNEQCARRIALIDLGAGLNACQGSPDWYQTGGNLIGWRAQSGRLWDGRGSLDHADGCDAFLSQVIDDFFSSSAPTFAELVRACGFQLMSECGESNSAEFLRFYELVMACERSTAARWDNLKDARQFNSRDNGELATLYHELTTGEGTVRKREEPLTSHNWGRTTGRLGLVCKIGHKGQDVAVSFEMP